MRKREREVTDCREKLAVLLGCGFLTLALRGEGAPYCVPLNFGAELEEGVLSRVAAAWAVARLLRAVQPA